MLRPLHRFPGLAAALVLIVLSLSGTVLATLNLSDTLRAPPQAESGLSVATLARRVATAYPGVEEIRRAPSGKITAFHFNAEGRPESVVIDPATGRGVAEDRPSGFRRWVTELHRSLFLGDAGRLVAAAAAAAMLLLAFSGLALAARRAGGWRHLLAPGRGPGAGRLHVGLALVSVSGFLLSGLTALAMVAATFDLLPTAAPVAFPAGVSGETGIEPGAIPALQMIPVESLRELTFPYDGDAGDAFTLRTASGEGYLDQGTGALLAWSDAGPWQRINETVYMLHTGEGAVWLGVILGLMALALPVLAVTGTLLWLRARRSRPAIARNAAAGAADTILLVGSEGGSTWGFAAALLRALREAGHSVHVAAMSTFAPGRYPGAKRLLVLAATYGDGDAPASAAGFLDRVARHPALPGVSVAVLGFGDRQFPAFCRYADAVAGALRRQGWAELLPMATVDGQSPQDFALWARALGERLGHPLEVAHDPGTPRARILTLVSRRDYGEDTQAPSAILRFALPGRGLRGWLAGRRLGRFAPGDLLAVLPEGDTAPRFYSLASGSRDGFVEICVRRHPGGLCSGQLLALAPGESVRAFIRPNARFRPAAGDRPVILIGAGTGIGPLAGMARANRRRRPMHLFLGVRHPESDLFYGPEIEEWRADRRLTTVTAAFSRQAPRAWVQDSLRADASRIVRLIEEGAQVLVCGGRQMAAGVAETIAEILAPAGLSPAVLRAEGRYVEDAY